MRNITPTIWCISVRGYEVRYGNGREKKAIFGIINKTLQSPPKVTAYYDNTDTYRIDMYIGADCHEKGFTTYSTIGLSEYPIYLTDITGRQIVVEYIGICQSGYTEFADILASCAFNIIKNGCSCAPGMVYPNIICVYHEGLAMKHIYYTTPSSHKELHEQQLDSRLIKWLLAIPISDNELEYLKEHGAEAFETLLEDNDTPFFDLSRPSVI